MTTSVNASRQRQTFEFSSEALHFICASVQEKFARTRSFSLPPNCIKPARPQTHSATGDGTAPSNQCEKLVNRMLNGAALHHTSSPHALHFRPVINQTNAEKRKVHVFGLSAFLSDLKAHTTSTTPHNDSTTSASPSILRLLLSPLVTMHHFKYIDSDGVAHHEHVDRNGVAHHVLVPALTSWDDLPEDIREMHHRFISTPCSETPQKQEEALRGIIELAIRTLSKIAGGRDLKEADRDFTDAIYDWFCRFGSVNTLDKDVRSKFPEWLLVEVNALSDAFALRLHRAVQGCAAIEKLRKEHP